MSPRVDIARSDPGDEAFTEGERERIRALEADLSRHLAHKPRRLAHSLSVGREAERLARVYGLDPYPARIAGILHDWEKATDDADLVAIAREAGLQDGFSEDLSLVAPLLHGPMAKVTLPERYPWLTDEVLQAISRHTLGASDMSPLDMVLFVADGIEPTRGRVEALEAQRAMVGKASLFELWWRAFRDGIAYVIDTSRHLYPKTVEIYNEVVAGLSGADARP